MFQKLTIDEQNQIAEKNYLRLLEMKKNSLTEDEYKEFIKTEKYKEVFASPLQCHFSELTGYDKEIYDVLGKIVKYDKEVLQLLCFDKNKKLLSDEVIITGEKNKVDFDFRIILKNILKNKDTVYFILNHNHPMCTGAKFSTADENVAFYTARLGELMGIYLLDFIVVTEYDVLSLKVAESKSNMKDKIIDYEIGGVFEDRSIMLSNKKLYTMLYSLKNKRKIQKQEPLLFVEEKTDEKDGENLGKLIMTILSKSEKKNRDKIIEEIEEVLLKWK